MIKHIVVSCLCFFALTGLNVSTISAESPDIEPQANQTLQQMSDYLDTLTQFVFQAETTVDSLFEPGLKVQYTESVKLFVRRPDRLRANVRGDLRNQDLLYDGKSITLFNLDHRFYATIEKSSDIETAVDYALQTFELEAPLADIVYRDSYTGLTENVITGYYLGLSTVYGLQCHHLLFEQDDLDWQIWIEDSPTPRPRKIVITSKWLAGAPQFTAVFTEWDESPQLPESLFSFVAPENSEQIEFLPAAETDIVE